jgi:hypothetical protein
MGELVRKANDSLFTVLLRQKKDVDAVLARSQSLFERKRRFNWVFEHLWDRSARNKLRIEVADTILFTNGRPSRWMFTAKDGYIMKRKSAALEGQGVDLYNRIRADLAKKALKPNNFRNKLVVIKSKGSEKTRVLNDAQFTDFLGKGWGNILMAQAYVHGREGMNHRHCTFFCMYTIKYDGTAHTGVCKPSDARIAGKQASRGNNKTRHAGLQADYTVSVIASDTVKMLTQPTLAMVKRLEASSRKKIMHIKAHYIMTDDLKDRDDDRAVLVEVSEVVTLQDLVQQKVRQREKLKQKQNQSAAFTIDEDGEEILPSFREANTLQWANRMREVEEQEQEDLKPLGAPGSDDIYDPCDDFAFIHKYGFGAPPEPTVPAEDDDEDRDLDDFGRPRGREIESQSIALSPKKSTSPRRGSFFGMYSTKHLEVVSDQRRQDPIKLVGDEALEETAQPPHDLRVAGSARSAVDAMRRSRSTDQGNFKIARQSTPAHPLDHGKQRLQRSHNAKSWSYLGQDGVEAKGTEEEGGWLQDPSTRAEISRNRRSESKERHPGTMVGAVALRRIKQRRARGLCCGRFCTWGVTNFGLDAVTHWSATSLQLGKRAQTSSSARAQSDAHRHHVPVKTLVQVEAEQAELRQGYGWKFLLLSLHNLYETTPGPLQFIDSDQDMLMDPSLTSSSSASKHMALNFEDSGQQSRRGFDTAQGLERQLEEEREMGGAAAASKVTATMRRRGGRHQGSAFVWRQLLRMELTLQHKIRSLRRQEREREFALTERKRRQKRREQTLQRSWTNEMWREPKEVELAATRPAHYYHQMWIAHQTNLRDAGASADPTSALEALHKLVQDEKATRGDWTGWGGGEDELVEEPNDGVDDAILRSLRACTQSDHGETLAGEGTDANDPSASGARLLLRLHEAATQTVPVAERYSRAPVCARCMAMYTALSEDQQTSLILADTDPKSPPIERRRVAKKEAGTVEVEGGSEAEVRRRRRSAKLQRQDTESLGVDLLIGTAQQRSVQDLELQELESKARAHEMHIAMQLTQMN